GTVPAAVRDGLRAAFPSGDETLDTELSRTLAMIEDDAPAVTRAALARLGAKNATSDVHYLAVLGRLRGPLDVERVAAALLTVERRLAVTPDTNWPPRLAEIHAALAARAPGLNAALLADARFGSPEHAVLTRAKGIDRAAAAGRFLARSEDAGFAWNAELVRLVAELPAERSLPALRGLWGAAGVDDAVLPVLAKHARPEDRPKLLTGLTSAQLDLVRAVLGGLERLPADRAEVIPLLRALRQLPAGAEAEALRWRLTARLERAAGRKEADLEAWAAWARKEYPDQAAALSDPDGVDAAAWGRRLLAIDWAKGDAGRGAAVFVKASCAACHSGAAALGPDLAGVAKRFSRADLLTAIVRPSKDVSERYRTTRVVTARGAVHQGVIVYEAVDGLILQTGPGQTVRVPGVPAKSRSPLSLMPSGLLDRLSDADVADLMAHLAGR
ncbi:MAG: c-type cytochrome, partial [Gemmataceae bacterium]